MITKNKSENPARNAKSNSASTKSKTSDADKRIYEAVFLAVRSQQLRPGTKLTENSLSELFGVSRTIVRKALQRLAHEHIVELRPNRGATVASPSREETSEVFAARRAIEAAILPMVVAKANKSHIAKLKQHIRMEHHAFESGDRPTWIHLTGEFHLMLAEIGGNRVLSRYLSELVSRCSLIIAMYDSSSSMPCDNDEHDRVIDLVAARDLNGVVEMMDQHLLEIEQRLNLREESASINLAQILKIA
jgi:DNA-binding GntR family transcriptional regulator